MLFHTFVHIPGIGEATERRLWEAGVLDWDRFVAPYPAFLSGQRIRMISAHLERGRELLGRPAVDFARHLPPAQRWRLYPHYRESTAFLDIESTGLRSGESVITTISLYDGRSVVTYVRGENLEQFSEDIDRYQLLVTYNGAAFDLPMLEGHFGFRFRQAHIDLRPLLRSLGFVGGLKGCERQLGLDRGQLAGLDGYCAVLLWNEYQRSRDRRFLETLLAYNVEDTVNLELLLVKACNLKLAGTPFAASHFLPLPPEPWRPFQADPEVVARLQGGGSFSRPRGL